MSADNWAVCPECRRRDPICNLDTSMREDYEIGVDPDGVFRLVYICSCRDCGFRWKFELETDEPRKVAVRPFARRA